MCFRIHPSIPGSRSHPKYSGFPWAPGGLWFPEIIRRSPGSRSHPDDYGIRSHRKMFRDHEEARNCSGMPETLGNLTGFRSHKEMCFPQFTRNSFRIPESLAIPGYRSPWNFTFPESPGTHGSQFNGTQNCWFHPYLRVPRVIQRTPYSCSHLDSGFPESTIGLRVL